MIHKDIIQHTVLELRQCDDALSICHFCPGFRGYGLTAPVANSVGSPLTPTQLSLEPVSI